MKGRGRSMTPPVIRLLERLSPKQEAREWLPAISIIYMAPGGHRQWPMSIIALLDRLSWILLQTRSLALAKRLYKGTLSGNPDIEVDQRLPLHRQFPTSSLTLEPKWEATRLGNMFPRGMTLITSTIQDTLEPLSHLSTHFMQLSTIGRREGFRMLMSGVSRKHGLITIDYDFRVIDPPGYIWGLPVLVPTCPKKLFSEGPRRKYVDHCH